MAELKVTRTVSITKQRLTLQDLREIVEAAQGLSNTATVTVSSYDGSYQGGGSSTITVTQNG